MANKTAAGDASAADIVARAAAEVSTPEADTEAAYECPFCVMMRKGGCETVFKAFMECGEKADKGQQEMADCLPQFEALHLCMEKNKAVFDGLLQEMQQEEGHREPAAVQEDSGQHHHQQQQEQQQQQQQQQATERNSISSSTDNSNSSSCSSSGGLLGSAAQVQAAGAETSAPTEVRSQSRVHDSIPLEGMAGAS